MKTVICDQCDWTGSHLRNALNWVICRCDSSKTPTRLQVSLLQRKGGRGTNYECVCVYGEGVFITGWGPKVLKSTAKSNSFGLIKTISHTPPSILISLKKKAEPASKKSQKEPKGFCLVKETRVSIGYDLAVGMALK